MTTELSTTTRTAPSHAFDVAAYLYPWDVVGDPSAPEGIARLGLDHVTVAAVYHATRALTPRHPAHRVVVADHTAAYFRPDAERWARALLRPPLQTWMNSPDPFRDAASALAAAGVPTHAWVVVGHVDPPAGAEFGPVVVNAYGDRYPWALCPSRAEVRDYAVRLAADAVSQPHVAGVEFEACGWYGFDHLHAHDKVAGVPLDQVEQFLFSLCFCAACSREYQQEGVDPGRLRATVRATLDGAFGGGDRHPTAGLTDVEQITAALGSDLAEAVLGMRRRVADRLRAEVVSAVRRIRPEAGFSVVFHGNPRSYRSTAFTGLTPATVPTGADGVVVNCWGSPAEAAETVAMTMDGARPDLRVLAGLAAVAGMGARPGQTAQVLSAIRESGASGIRIYHAGLASRADLDAIATLAALAHAVDDTLRTAVKDRARDG